MKAAALRSRTFQSSRRCRSLSTDRATTVAEIIASISSVSSVPFSISAETSACAISILIAAIRALCFCSIQSTPWRSAMLRQQFVQMLALRRNRAAHALDEAEALLDGDARRDELIDIGDDIVEQYFLALEL
jgi:hypothetical protein